MTAARNFLSCLALSTAIVGALASPAAAVPVTVALSDAAVPEGNGDFNNFYPAVLNDFGQVAFRAFLKNTSGGTADDGGVYLFNGSALENLARENDAVPEGNGDYNGFDNPVLNNSGQVAFEASLKNTSGSTLDNSGIYLFNGSALENLAREDAAVPEGNGNFNVFQNPVLNDSGQVAFEAALRYTSGGMDDDGGVYLFNGSALENLVREDAAAPDGNGDFTFLDYPVLNDSGQVAFEATLKNTSGGATDNTGIYLFNGSALENLVRENNAVPEGNGDFNFFHYPVLNNSGQVAFRAFLKNTSGGSADDTGIYFFNGSALENLARENDAVPEGNGNFNVVQDPVLNDSGQVAFRATLKNTSGGTADDSGIYLFNGSALENLARENAAAPDGNGDFKSFANPILNDSGQVAFRAFFKNTSGGIADDSGIYLADGIEQLRVVREGDVLAGKTVSTATLAVDYGSLAGHGSGLNDLGQVAYMAFFSGGGSGIFLFTPELHFRGTAADSQWDSKTNWTLSIDPAFVHTVHVDPSVATTIDGPATATTVSGLNVNTAGVGTTTLDLKPGAPLTVSGLTTVGTNGRIAGNGTLIATGGVNNAGEIDLGTSSMLVMGGTISNTGVVRGNGQINNPIDNLNGGEFRVAAGQRQEWTSTSAHNNAGRIEVIGNLTLPGGVAELEIDAAVVNAASTGLITGRDAALRFQGGLTNEGSIGLSFGISDIFGDIDNTGIISVGGGGQATFYDDLTQNGTLNIAATGGSVSSVVVFGEFSGSGGFTGGGDLFQLGDLRIGNSPASVTMGGNLHLGASTNTEIELAGLGVGDFDQALISGDLSLAGSLSVSALGGFTPGFGQEFLIFDVMGTRTGQFFGLGEGDLVGDFGGTELFVSYLGGDGNDVMLYAASAPVPEPSTYALGAIGLLGLGLYGWRRKRSSPVN